MNADCEFVVMDFKALIPSLLQGKFDALVSQINPLPERKAKALFSVPIVGRLVDLYAADSTISSPRKDSGVGSGCRAAAQSAFIQKLYGDAVTVVLPTIRIRSGSICWPSGSTRFGKFNWTLALISKPEGRTETCWRRALGGDPVTENEQDWAGSFARTLPASP